MDDLVKRLNNPPFGTETSERNLMRAAADRIAALDAKVAAADALADAAHVIDGDNKGFNVSWVSLNALRTALAAYRGVGK